MKIFAVIKIVDSKHSSDNYSNLKMSTRATIKDLEMLKFVPDHVNTKNICKHTVKKSSFVIKYILDRFKTKEMCDKVVLENSAMLIFIPDCYKDQKIVC